MSQIIDVIFHKNMHYTQSFLVLDKMPAFLHERKFIGEKTWLIARDGIFRSAYYKNAPSPGFVAFGGRKFEIQLLDGTVEEATGQWWHGCPYDDTIPLEIATPEMLADCNVFMHTRIDKTVGETLLANYSTPSNNYYKYNKDHADYGKTTIISKWEDQDNEK